MIKIQSLVKSFRQKKVIDNINIDIAPGQIVSLLGTNGAGKTTLIKMMLGLEKPTQGHIFLNGQSPRVAASRLNVGVTPQVSHFVDELTSCETIKLVAKHYPKTMPFVELTQNFGLEEMIDQRIISLSEGEKRRLALALAFTGQPDIIFLDEPSVGLDIKSRLKLWEFIKSYRKPETIIFLTTHYMEEAEALSDRILVLQSGKIVKDGSLKEVCNNSTLENAFVKLIKDECSC